MSTNPGDLFRVNLTVCNEDTLKKVDALTIAAGYPLEDVTYQVHLEKVWSAGAREQEGGRRKVLHSITPEQTWTVRVLDNITGAEVLTFRPRLTEPLRIEVQK